MVKNLLISLIGLCLSIIIIVTAEARCITRYFVVEANQTAGYKANLVPDNDILPLAKLQSVKVATLLDGRKIIKVVLPKYIIKDMVMQTGLDDPLTIEGVIALGIASKFAGRTHDEVLFLFPELQGKKQVGVDEENNPVMVDKMRRVKWSCE